jgi:hypothetical protein
MTRNPSRSRQGHALRQGQADAAREQLQVDALGRVALAAVEVHGARPGVREFLQRLDVGERVSRIERVPVRGPEGFGVAGRELAGT